MKAEIKILKKLNILLPIVNVRVFCSLIVKVITPLAKDFLLTFIACSVSPTRAPQAKLCLPSEYKEFNKPVRHWKY